MQNPAQINVSGNRMYVYIKNLSPAQLSNDNPDIWRIQLPKRYDFETIKKSGKMFILLGYDYIRRVYTTWNPYWCKQRLNVAESCSMYSRLSLQKRVAMTQKIEKFQLQNDGDVVCIPATLIANYLKNIKKYYPEESKYVAIGSSLQKKYQEELQSQTDSSVLTPQTLFDRFIGCYDTDGFRDFLEGRGFQRGTITNYINRLIFVFEKGLLQNHRDIFLECANLSEYRRAINRFCWQPDLMHYEEMWHRAIQASLKQYLLFVEGCIYGTHNIQVRLTKEQREMGDEDKLNEATHETQTKETNLFSNPPSFELDEFGKLKKLDDTIIEQLLPLIKDVDYPDWEEVIKEVKAYYPNEATAKMNPADWMKLFDETKWRKRRGRKTTMTTLDRIKSSEQRESNSIRSQLTIEPTNEDYRIDTVNEEFSEFDTPSHQIDTKLLFKVFDNRVTSYKYLWFWSIITIAKEKRRLSISFKEIVIKMARFAWPLIFCDEIEFGPFDMMRIYLTDVMKKTRLIKNASENVVESYIIEQYDDLGLSQFLNPLLKNVPYRFLSPWISFTTIDDVIAKSNDHDYTGLYALQKDSIVIKEEWWRYIENNYDQIKDFIISSFLEYLKLYNYPLSLLNFRMKYKSK